MRISNSTPTCVDGEGGNPEEDSDMKCMMKVLSWLFAVWIALHAMVGRTVEEHSSECAVAKDRAKSQYGSLRYHFDAFNRCRSTARDDASACIAELDAQQAALGEFIFAQRVASDVCGRVGQDPSMP